MTSGIAGARRVNGAVWRPDRARRGASTEVGEAQASAAVLLERTAQFARHLAQAETLEDTLQRIVEGAEELLDECDGVSLMVVTRHGVSSRASSSRVAHESDVLQDRAGEGPCLSAIAERRTIVIEDLDTDHRWPTYRAKALELGIRGMLSLHLSAIGETIGALNAYSTCPHGFDRWSRSIGQAFAVHAAVALRAAVTEAGLVTALESRDLIGQAKGILMVRRGLTGQQSFEQLRALSQARNIKVRDLAAEIVSSKEVPDLAVGPKATSAGAPHAGPITTARRNSEPDVDSGRA